MKIRACGDKIFKCSVYAAAFLIMTALLSASLIIYTAADNDDAADTVTPDFMIIDDLSSPTLWKSQQAAVISAFYLPDTAYLSSGEQDISYALVRTQSAAANMPVTISRTFDTPLNLYNYGSVSFYIYINKPESGTEGEADDNADVFSVKMTLQSGIEYKVFEKNIDAGGWVHVVFSLEQWHLRTMITGISISAQLAGEAALSGESFPLTYRVDAVTALHPASVLFENTFMCANYTVAGGQYLYRYDKNEINVTSAAGDVAITGTAVHADPAAALAYNTLRVVISADDDIKVSLDCVSDTGQASSCGTRSVEANNGVTVLFFDMPDVHLCRSYTLSISGMVGNVTLYGVSALHAPDEKVTGIGTVDSAVLSSDGLVNIRGTVPSDAVVDHLNGKISIYCVPPYLDTETYINENEPVAEVDMTTRFNINIPATSLPDGYVCMRFAAVIGSGDDAVIIGAPINITSSEATAAKLPASAGSMKGIADISADGIFGSEETYVSANAGIIMITVDLSRLFGTASAGRLYSAAGEIYYFDSAYIKELDYAVRRLSEAGADCYLRVTASDSGLFYPDYEAVDEENPTGTRGAYALRADTASSFSALYAAVDFLSSRYNGGEYGYIRGMAAGMSFDDIYCGGTLSHTQRAELLSGVISVIYHTAAANISGFRVYIPAENDGITPSLLRGGEYDITTLLYLIGRHAGNVKPFSYGILWQTGDVNAGLNTVKAMLKQASAYAHAPDSIMLYYKPAGGIYNADTALLDYVSGYYAACADKNISGYIFDVNGMNDATKSGLLLNLRLLDTNRYVSVEMYLYESLNVSVSADAAAQKRAYPRVYETADDVMSDTVSVVPPAGISGEYALFDFYGAFDSKGWYAAGAGVECATVKNSHAVTDGVSGGRTMRAVYSSGGAIVYHTPATASLDLSDCALLRFNISASPAGEYELILYSPTGFYSVMLSVPKSDDGGFYSLYADISGYSGINAVTGIELRDNSGVPSRLYIAEIAVCSKTLGDDELNAVFSAAMTETDAGGDKSAQTETGVLELTAVCFLVVAVTAGAILVLRRRGVDTERDADERKMKRGAEFK